MANQSETNVTGVVDAYKHFSGLRCEENKENGR